MIATRRTGRIAIISTHRRLLHQRQAGKNNNNKILRYMQFVGSLIRHGGAGGRFVGSDDPYHRHRRREDNSDAR